MTLIPCGTLEDFPSFLEDNDARSLLAAWTAPWHPALLALTQRLPAWNRADSIPDPLSDQIVFLPKISENKLPSGFAAAADAATNCRIVRGSSRNQFLLACETDLRDLSIETVSLTAPMEVASETRVVTPDDFFALGYVWLQIQVMTRRLRYTSNIDEIYFTGRVIEAAKMMIAGNASATVSALHDAFDALAQERDHYFSNDPHLVDLTLLASSTLGTSLASTLDRARASNEPPFNFLIDCELAKAITQSLEPSAKTLLELIDKETVGIAGGGLPKTESVHHQTAGSIRVQIAEAKRRTDQTLGNRCQVFARADGPTPGDLASVIANQGYVGAIPIDFAAGEGWSNEAKLSWSSSSPTIDVLVSKPIDGSKSDSFLSLAVRLGQSIDSGEVSTALIVHWPGTESDAYRDLRRAASWGLALGRFWKIDEYFRDGQHPYHHYRGRADDGAAQWLSNAVSSGATQPLNTAAASYKKLISTEAATTISTLADLIRPLDDNTSKISSSVGDPYIALVEFWSRLGGTSRPDDSVTQGRLVVNPYSSPTRTAISMDMPPIMTDAVFGASLANDGRYDVTVDVPAHGFVLLQPSSTPLKSRWFVPRKKIATGGMLVNEFMQLEFSPTSGGIKGVYSGTGRGNRYSLRLVYTNDDAASEDRVAGMHARSLRVIRSDESVGIIEADGVLKSGANRAVADFMIRYSLARGSRWLWVEAQLTPVPSIQWSDNPWKSYFAFRSAIASEAVTLFAPLRDKLHRVESKRIDAPAGLLIDEIARQTLLFADGRPSYRQREDRFIDSLCMVRGESPQKLRFAVGFDLPSPINAMRSVISQPFVLACDAPSTTPSSGWLMHCSTPDVVICDLHTESVSPLTISFLVIASRAESRKAKIRFCRTVAIAINDQEVIKHSGDAIEVPLSGFEVAKIQVQFSES